MNHCCRAVQGWGAGLAATPRLCLNIWRNAVAAFNLLLWFAALPSFPEGGLATSEDPSGEPFHQARGTWWQ